MVGLDGRDGVRPVSRRPLHQPVRRGFTVIEAIATIVVLAVLGSITSLLILNAVDGYSDTATSAQLHGEASIALDRAVRELRRIELDSGASGIAPNIDTVTATSITWSDSGADSYSLSLSGADLMLAVDGGAAAVLLADATAFSVATYDESNTALAASLTGVACDPIRRVALEVTLQRHGVSETLRTKLFIRSTMSGGGS